MTDYSPGYAKLPESALVSMARNGDRGAFAALVSRHQSWIRNLMRRSCGDPDLAEDLAQQTFISAWQSLPTLRQLNAFHGWLKRMAINVWLQHARKADPLRDSERETALDGTAASVATAASGSAIDLDRALLQLPAQMRTCVVLNYHQGMSHQEIADLTALPLGTVKSNIRRGSEQLRRMLSAYEHGAVVSP